MRCTIAMIVLTAFVAVIAVAAAEDSGVTPFQDPALDAVVPEVAELVQNPASIAAAKAKADADAKAAADGAAQEAQFAKEESATQAKAAQLKTAANKLRDQATVANQKAASDAAANTAATMAKAEKANADTAQAEEDSAKFREEMKKLEADLKVKEDEDKVATEKRIKVVKAQLADLAAKKAKAEVEGQQAAAALKKSGADLAAKKKAIADGFKKKMADMGSELKAGQDALAKEKAMMDKHFADEKLSNEAKAAAAQGALKAKVAQDEKDAADAEAEITKKYGDIKVAQDKASADWEAKAAAEKAARDAADEKTKKGFEKKAADAQAEYDRKMNDAATLNKVAADARLAYAASLKKSEDDQTAADKTAESADAKDAEDTECAIDGSECRTATGECKKIGPNGPYLGADYVSCSANKADHGGEYGGEAWMGADFAPDPVVPEAPSPECTTKMAQDPDAKYAIENSGDVSPAEYLACGSDNGQSGEFVDKYKKTVHSMGVLLDAMSICPEYCYPNTATDTDDGVSDTLGNCIDKSFYAGFKEMVYDMPVYKAAGTGNRFKAGDPGPALCTAVRSAMKAASGVAGAPMPDKMGKTTQPATAGAPEVAAAGELIPDDVPLDVPIPYEYTACDVQDDMKKAAKGGTEDGKPGPMTLIVGDGEGRDAVLGSPCISPNKVYDPENGDSMWSATKLITSITIGMLVDQDKLHYDAPMSDYFQYWTKDAKDPRSKITLKHLLSQTAGFGDHGCSLIPTLTYAQCTKMLYDTAYGKFADGVPFVFGDMKVPALFRAATFGLNPDSFPSPDSVEPGQYFWYSSAQWQVLGALIEMKAGMGYPLAVQTLLGSKVEVKPPVFNGPPHADPGGGLLGSADVYAKVLLAYTSGKMVSKQTMETMETPWTLNWNSKRLGYVAKSVHGHDEGYVGYALGMWVDCTTRDCSEAPVYHSVGGRGFLPFFDRRNGYWGVLARQAPVFKGDFAPIFKWGAGFSEHLVATLAPSLIGLYSTARKSKDKAHFGTKVCPAPVCPQLKD